MNKDHDRFDSEEINPPQESSYSEYSLKTMFIEESMNDILSRIKSIKVLSCKDSAAKKHFINYHTQEILNIIIKSDSWSTVKLILEDEQIPFEIQEIKFAEEYDNIHQTTSFKIMLTNGNHIVLKGVYEEPAPDDNYRITDKQNIIILFPLPIYWEIYLYFILVTHLEELLFDSDGVESKIATPKVPNYYNLFYNEEHSIKVLTMLELKQYIDNKNKWLGKSGINSELNALCQELIRRKLLTSQKKTTVGRAFYEKFGLKVGTGTSKNAYITDRQLRNYLNNDDVAEFSNILDELFPQTK